MSKELFYFATVNDLLERLRGVEKTRKIKYVKCGRYSSQNYIEYSTIDDFPNIGTNTSGDHQTESYLILNIDVAVNSYAIEQIEGGLMYFVNQQGNERSIVFWPGGFYDENHLICGHIGTISNHEMSLQLYNFFSKSFTKNSKKVGRYYIGDEVLTIANQVRLITVNINQPVEYDLKII